MPLFRWLSLRQLLTLPYVVLVLGLAMVLGGLSYRTGRDAVDELSNRLLLEMVGRIGRAVEQHLSASERVLDTAFPRGEPAPARVAHALPELRTRFWLATSVHPELNNYAYYGDEQGHFFGLWRDGPEAAQLRLRTRDQGPRTLYRFEGLHGALHDPRDEDKIFEPRQRPWYLAAQASAAPETWTPIYIDFRTNELVTTRARRVAAADGHIQGVVATDVSLRQLGDFVQSLKPSAHGVAFVVEPGGELIATSTGALMRRGADGQSLRSNAAESGDPILATTYREVRALMAAEGNGEHARSTQIDGPEGRSLQVAYARMRENAGLDWIIAVAVPRSDFLHRVTDNLYRTIALSLLAALAVVGVGWLSLGVVSRDLRAIGHAARQVGEGRFDAPLEIRRQDEIGDLAQSFAAMTHKLATDRLTGLANREATLRRIGDRIEQHRRQADAVPFALLFLDLDGFKAVNDTHGHDVGDQVLRTLAERMLQAVREGDLVARWAGDEFLVVLDGVGDEPQARRVADKLQAALAAPMALIGDTPLGVSIGVALHPADGDDVMSLVQRADADMYRRKKRP